MFDDVRPAPAAVYQSQGLAVSRDGSRFFIAQFRLTGGGWPINQTRTNGLRFMSVTSAKTGGR
jgi:hypothetical protein